MTTRTVRLDDEAEQALTDITDATGLSVSAALKQGLHALREQIERDGAASPFEVYQQMDLGPGGYTSAPSDQAKQAVREKIRRKIHRRF